MKKARRYRNFLLFPSIQLKTGFGLLLLLFIFFGLTFYFSFYRWSDILAFLIELTDIPESTRELLVGEMYDFLFELGVILFVQMLFVGSLVIVFTHRFLGPSFAIEQYLKKRDFSQKLVLRKNDFLKGVAKSINKLVDEFKSKEG